MRKYKYVPPYKHLLGAEVIFVRGGTRRPFKCFVAGISYRKGITIKYLEEGQSILNNENNAICVNRVTVPKERYHKLFIEVVGLIKSGIVELHTEGRRMDPCAFS